MTLDGSDHPLRNEETVAEVDYSSAKSPTHAVVKTLADLKDDFTHDPLYDRIETGAMNDLFHHAQRSDSYVGIEFTVGKYTVTINSNERIFIYEGNPVTNNGGLSQQE